MDQPPRVIATTDVRASGRPYHQVVTTGHGHALTADEPESAGGGNAGPAPYELLLAGLGACTTMTLQMYAERKGWDIGHVQVGLTVSKDADKQTFIDRTLSTDAALTDAQWNKLLEIAAKTPVTRTLADGARITTRVASDARG